MRLLLIIGIPIFFIESCFLLLTNGSQDSNQLNYCNDTACAYEVPADYADCRSRNLVNIPPQCSSAVYLDIRKNDLHYIGNTSFSKFKNLKFLYIDGNHIKNITPRAFAECTSLRRLFLQNNPIFLVRSEAFAGLVNLRELYLNSAELQIIQPHAFDDLRTLQNLYLSDNKLNSLPPNLLQNLENLEVLTLANNKLNTLDDNIFQGLIRLQYLDLKQNGLTALPNGLFNGMPILSRLTLSYNSIHIIEKGAIDFNQLSRLDTLDIRNNSITTLRNVSKNLPSIPKLYLAGNPINCTCDINGLLLWYQRHPNNANESGAFVICHSPPMYAGQLVRDVINVTLPCERIPEQISLAPHYKTMPLSLPNVDTSSTRLIDTNIPLKKEKEHFQDEKHQTPASNPYMHIAIGIPVLTAVVIIIVLLIVFKKCNARHTATEKPSIHITPNPLHQNARTPTSDYEPLYEPIAGDAKDPPSSDPDQHSINMNPQAPPSNNKGDFNSQPPLPSEIPPTIQQPIISASGYISLPSLMTHLSVPTSNTATQQHSPLATPYAVNLIGQEVSTEIDCNNNTQNFPLTSHHHPIATQASPVLQPEILQNNSSHSSCVPQQSKLNTHPKQPNLCLKVSQSFHFADNI
ncbi:uncharacterized protein [Amphiura filiformis]|uniref:uncharacterized protein n=1 Tax=Amphiura filiformis TaxID=82378 RepID=UPI003B215D39